MYLVDVGLFSDVDGSDSFVFSDHPGNVGHRERRIRHLTQMDVSHKIMHAGKDGCTSIHAYSTSYAPSPGKKIDARQRVSIGTYVDRSLQLALLTSTILQHHNKTMNTMPLSTPFAPASYESYVHAHVKQTRGLTNTNQKRRFQVRLLLLAP